MAGHTFLYLHSKKRPGGEVVGVDVIYNLVKPVYVYSHIIIFMHTFIHQYKSIIMLKS